MKKNIISIVKKFQVYQTLILFSFPLLITLLVSIFLSQHLLIQNVKKVQSTKQVIGAQTAISLTPTIISLQASITKQPITTVTSPKNIIPTLSTIQKTNTSNT